MSVYKMAGKDGRGAWFARRSVHEGLGFRKWKLGLQREFPESMEVQGGPGEGNIRGIGSERRVESITVDGVGTIEGEFDEPLSARVMLNEHNRLTNSSIPPVRSIPWSDDAKRLRHITGHLFSCT